jgi:hypothetical protein
MMRTARIIVAFELRFCRESNTGRHEGAGHHCTQCRDTGHAHRLTEL